MKYQRNLTKTYESAVFWDVISYSAVRWYPPNAIFTNVNYKVHFFGVIWQSIRYFVKKIVLYKWLHISAYF